MGVKPDLRVLRELTENLPSRVGYESEGVAVYRSPTSGATLALRIFRDPKDRVAVQRSFIPAGAELAIHEHNEVHVVVVYEGSLEFHFPETDTSIILGVGASVRIPPRTPHTVRALEDTYSIGISVPWGEGFP